MTRLLVYRGEMNQNHWLPRSNRHWSVRWSDIPYHMHVCRHKWTWFPGIQQLNIAATLALAPEDYYMWWAQTGQTWGHSSSSYGDELSTPASACRIFIKGVSYISTFRCVRTSVTGQVDCLAEDEDHPDLDLMHQAIVDMHGSNGDLWRLRLFSTMRPITIRAMLG